MKIENTRRMILRYEMGKRNRRRGCKYPIRRDETKGEGEEEERSEISRV